MMEAHLALSCHKVPHDIKEKFLLIVKTRGDNQLEYTFRELMNY